MNNKLRFFILGLLTVEGLLAIALVCSSLSNLHKAALMSLGGGICVLIAFVVLSIWCKSTNLQNRKPRPSPEVCDFSSLQGNLGTRS